MALGIDIVITGGGGVLGKCLAKELRQRRLEVACLDLPGREGVNAVWDISRQDSPEPDLHPGTVIHAAALMAAWGQPWPMAQQVLNVNALGTLRVAHWCLEKKVSHLILISGALVYGFWERPAEETTPAQPWLAGGYAISKWASEKLAELVRTEGCKLTILRPSSLYGPGYQTGLIPRLLRLGRETGVVSINPPFHDAFDLLHVRDAVGAIVSVLEKQCDGLWNLGGGEPVTLLELAQACATHTGADLKLNEELNPRAARILNWVDDTLARKQLGHHNQVAVLDGIAEIVRWLDGE